MKKMISIILLFSLLMVGCGKNKETTNLPETAPTNTTEIPVTSATENPNGSSAPMPMITVSVPVTKSEMKADDGTVIFRDVRQNMQLVMPDQDVADKIIIDFLSRIDQATAESNDIAMQAEEAYTDANYWMAYLNSITYAPMRIDQGVLSLYGSMLQYSGGAHAIHVSRAANYNTVTGDVLTLGSILVNEAALEQLCGMVIAHLDEVREEKYLRDDFADAVQQRFQTDESYDENWYFSNKGLCFYFDQYEIAPYASGIITAEIPYSELIGIIDDAFFPPETETYGGIVMTSPVQDVDMSKFTRISEVVIDPEAPMYVIYCSDIVQNLRISLNDVELGSKYTVFAAQALCDSDAVVIQAELNKFRIFDISYDSNEETVTVTLLTE